MVLQLNSQQLSRLGTFVCLFLMSTLTYLFVGTHHSMHLEVRGQAAGICSLVLPCGTLGLNPGSQAWWQEPLPTHPSHQPNFVF